MFYNKENENNKSNKSDYAEKQATGALKWKTYFTFFRVSGGLFGSILLFFTFIADRVSITVTEYWLNRWAAIEYQQFNNFKNTSQLINQTLPQGILEYKNRINYYHIYSGFLNKNFQLLISNYFKNYLHNSIDLRDSLFSSI